MLNRNADLAVAGVCLVLGLVAAILWVPNDSETPMIYTFRRQTYMGDAFLPTVAAVIIAIAALAQLVLTWLRRATDATEKRPFDGETLAFFLQSAAIIAVALTVMFWAGSLAVTLFAASAGDELVTYRQMRSTFPYRLIGFAAGGLIMAFGLMFLLEGRLSKRIALASIATVAGLILLFDVPFDTLLLPPNGDW